MVNPTTFDFWVSFFFTVGYNISDKKNGLDTIVMNKIIFFPDSEVTKAYNGDHGCYYLTKLDPEFGQEYEFCAVNLFFKENYGCFIEFRLFKDEEHIGDYSDG